MLRRGLFTLAPKLALLTSLCACQGDQLHLKLAWPPTGPIRSALVVTALPNGRMWANAVDPEAALSAGFDLAPGVEAASVYVLGFEFTLAELSLQPGPVPLGDGRRLRPPIVSFSSELSPRGSSPWVREETLPTALADLRLAESLADACSRRFDVSGVNLPLAGESPKGRVRVLLPLDDGSALLATFDGFAYRITESAATPLPELTGAQFFGGFRAPDGELWLARSDGFWRGRLGALAPAPSPQRLGRTSIWIDGAVVDGQLVLLSLNDLGDVARFRDGRWTEIGRVPVGGNLDPEDSDGGLALEAGGERAIIAAPYGFRCDNISCAFDTPNADLYALEGTTLRPAATLGSLPVSVARRKSGEILVGTYAGGVFSSTPPHSADTWMRVEAAPGGAGSIVEVDGGLLLALGRGEITAVLDGLEACPARVFKLGYIQKIARLGDAGSSEKYALAYELDLLQELGGDSVTIMTWRR